MVCVLRPAARYEHNYDRYQEDHIHDKHEQQSHEGKPRTVGTNRDRGPVNRWEEQEKPKVLHERAT
jgi:hypothetical protein